MAFMLLLVLLCIELTSGKGISSKLMLKWLSRVHLTRSALSRRIIMHKSMHITYSAARVCFFRIVLDRVHNVQRTRPHPRLISITPHPVCQKTIQLPVQYQTQHFVRFGNLYRFDSPLRQLSKLDPFRANGDQEGFSFFLKRGLRAMPYTLK